MGGGLEVLTEAAAGVPIAMDNLELARAQNAQVVVDAQNKPPTEGSPESPETEVDVEGSSSSALQRAACRAIKPGSAHFDPKSWTHPTLPKPLKPGLVKEVKRRCPEAKCDNWKVPRLAAWLYEHPPLDDDEDEDAVSQDAVPQVTPDDLPQVTPKAAPRVAAPPTTANPLPPRTKDAAPASDPEPAPSVRWIANKMAIRIP